VILYFLRHGQAAPAVDGDDAARELTPDGERELRSAAPLWQRLNLRPDVVLSSPVARARRTATLVCDAVGTGVEPEVDAALAPGAGWPQMARGLTRHPDARRVMFVGHEPDLSTAVCELTGASSVRLRPGGVACVEFYGVPEPGGGEIAWLLDPDLYSSDGRGRPDA
jgi:phosphohistidine phosphatase